jgi:HEAT repeat protein
MAVSMEDVVRQLSPDEADLRQAAAALGREALPFLETLVRGPDTMLAAKAVHVAAWLQDPRSVSVLELAAASQHKMVRVAAATAAARLAQDQASSVFVSLLADEDAECRRIAIESIQPGAIPRVRVQLEMLALTDPYPFIRELAARALASSPKPESPEQQQAK